MASDPVHDRPLDAVVVPLLVSPSLVEADFVHGFTTRTGTLCDLAVHEAVVYMVSQVHGATVVRAGGDPLVFRNEQADAIVLSAGQVGAVRVADCVPVLVGDKSTGRAAAIHAGWRGVASGVVPAALTAMRARPADLVAAIGPCIESCCFEVSEEVADEITFAVPAPGVELRREGGKAWIDLVAAVRAQLEACGVPTKAIDRVGGCTKCDAKRYHSYRRDGAKSGRMLGIILGSTVGT